MNIPMKICHITTVPQSLNFVRGQVSYMKDRGFEVHAISSPGKQLEEFADREQITVSAVEMLRSITPVKDIRSLWQLWRSIRRIKPEIVHAHTPKGGLLGMISAWMAGAPVRIYHIRGLPFMTATGLKRKILIATENISCSLAHQVLCVSHSIRDVAVNEGICSADKIKALRSGSGNGVDAAQRFNPASWGTNRSDIRLQYGIPVDAVVIGFVGRIVRDKGIVELIEAWQSIVDQYPKVYLMLIGPFEPQDPVPSETIQLIKNGNRIVLTGGQEDSAPFYTAMDICVLPTYREGFPNVPMEAAAMGLPVVATQIPGCIDAVQDGVTGTLVPPRDSQSLARAIKAYLDDPDLRRKHGQAGRERVLRDFRPEDIWEAVYQEYIRLLKSKGLDVPEAHTATSEASVNG
ncbi:MAG: glycosyltransferase family 4 protein [Armatimonadota bacterium]